MKNEGLLKSRDCKYNHESIQSTAPVGVQRLLRYPAPSFKHSPFDSLNYPSYWHLMRLSLILVVIAATLLTWSDASNLRSSNKVVEDAEEEERTNVVRSFFRNDFPEVAAEPLKVTLKDKILNVVAKLIPSTERFDGKFVYKGGAPGHEQFKFTQPLRGTKQTLD
ncbi:hypothetical protein F441_10973 [Phytophthora nicotianae CJ01A1]|nr:hypothetical protein L916_10673 [Phytophthora nicotianae]ETL90805.1 hypothetical protein L917_10572 [Phytophthora nicotianae]ETP14028.1 hypothetical protein F441_10973 [Phytophthora nicotianae CJ01A1]